jgi:hypothetical protein
VVQQYSSESSYTRMRTRIIMEEYYTGYQHSPPFFWMVLRSL